MSKLVKFSGGLNIILIIIIILIILFSLAFRGYTECECEVKFNEQTQAYWTVCPTAGTISDFWKTVRQGWTGVC